MPRAMPPLCLSSRTLDKTWVRFGVQPDTGQCFIGYVCRSAVRQTGPIVWDHIVYWLGTNDQHTGMPLMATRLMARDNGEYEIISPDQLPSRLLEIIEDRRNYFPVSAPFTVEER